MFIKSNRPWNYLKHIYKQPALWSDANISFRSPLFYLHLLTQSKGNDMKGMLLNRLRIEGYPSLKIIFYNLQLSIHEIVGALLLTCTAKYIEIWVKKKMRGIHSFCLEFSENQSSWSLRTVRTWGLFFSVVVRSYG